jgi:hypothetical protein
MLSEIIKLCKEYSELGWAIQEQLDKLLEDQNCLSELNPNAVKYIDAFLNHLKFVLELV